MDLLGHPTESPYGNPIPGLDDLSAPPSVRFLEGVVSLVPHVRAQDGPTQVVIRRLAEPAQFDPEQLGQLKATGVLPGATATASAVPGGVRLEVDGFEDALVLPAELAAHVFVAA
jgi:DtxR family Mn-dependent transcriptional regulator